MIVTQIPLKTSAWEAWTETDEEGYCTVVVSYGGDQLWSREFEQYERAEAAGLAYIEGAKMAYATGYPGAANYVLGAGQWPGAQANVGNDSPVLCKQRAGEWFTTWLVRLALETAQTLGDKDGEAKWQAEYDRCSEGAK